MTEVSLLEAWSRARNQLIFAQLPPTFLLITTVGLVPEIRNAGMATVWASLGILLASGILGALVEFGAASDSQAIARDLASLQTRSRSADVAISHARWMWVPRFVTPAIFVLIFLALVWALLF